jgi:hypothetical protein
MAMLEKWYVWDKKTEIRSAKKCMLNGDIIEIVGRVIDPSIPALTKGVSCYTLGETRERVECEYCDGEGGIDIFDTFSDYIYRDQCYRCKCRGYIWKTEVAQ